MRAFSCDVCSNLLIVENSVCVSCGTAVGFSPAEGRLVPIEGRRQCLNLSVAACNWLLDDDRPDGLCLSCRLTRTRPAAQDSEAMAAWAETETAKRRLVYQLLDLGLPVTPRSDDPAGFEFDLLSSSVEPVITGHEDGLVTIDLAEGEDAHREAMRVQMDEPYRTMLGHLRHEVGHYFWEVLVDRAGDQAVADFRRVFGDERADYGEALQRHYAAARADWAADHVSAYASAHPWEDWAETFAHYLHIRDTLQTAAAYGMVVTGPPSIPLFALPRVEGDTDTVTPLVDTWLPLTFALNAVNRSMGKGDLYPFVLTPSVITKLGVVHDLVARRTAMVTSSAAAGRR